MSVPSPIVEFREYQDLADILEEKRIVSVGVGAKGDAIILAVDREYADAPFEFDLEASGIAFPRTIAKHPYPALVIRMDEGYTNTTYLPELEAAFPRIQALNNDHVLIVSSRCHYRNGRAEMIRLNGAGMVQQHRRSLRSRG